MTRISNATIDDIIFYDPAAERRADSIQVDWSKYFDVASQEWLYRMEFGWWKSYVDTVLGGNYYKTINGRLMTAFDPSRLIKSHQTLIRLDTFGAIKIFYESLVTDVSNLNEVDLENFKFAKDRMEAEWDKAIQMSNWYDLSGTNPNGPVGLLEQNWLADDNFFNGDRRYM